MITTTKLPQTLVDNTIFYFGDDGQRWLDGLAIRLRDVSRRWGLRLEPPFENLTTNFVAPVSLADGTSAVLKLGLPTDQLAHEAGALEAYGGNGAVRLLNSDVREGCLLLEMITPGRSLLQLENAGLAVRDAAAVMRQLHQARVDIRLPTVQVWLAEFGELRNRFAGTPGPLDARLFATAEGLAKDLLQSSSEPCLLHGDLHHANILEGAGRSWAAIDPKGVVGEREYEVGAYMRNWMPDILQGNTREVTDQRLAIFHEELGFDVERMLSWSFVQAVLSAVWMSGDSREGWRNYQQLAQIFRLML